LAVHGQLDFNGLPLSYDSEKLKKVRMVRMKKTIVALLFLFLGTTLFAQTIVSWQTVKGVITAPGVSNPVAGIASGALPWTTTAGAATVDLANGDFSFNVVGLVLIGGNSSGTTDGITNVKGTLVCNATTTPAVYDTAEATLSATGNAGAKGKFATAIISPCADPLFLIRVATTTPATSPWIATGTVRVETP
jgi:hypothetical protein